MGKRLFLDTYAMMEIIEGNPKYNAYLDCTAITSLLNLYELYYNLFKKHGKDVADLQYERFRSIAIEIEKKHIQKAAEIKKKTKISYVDALGYAIAQLEKIMFLTGDNDFKGMEGIEFVK